MDGDDGNVQFACAYETTHVEEAAELQGIVSQLVDASRDADAEKLFTRYHQIVRLQTRINISAIRCHARNVMLTGIRCFCSWPNTMSRRSCWTLTSMALWSRCQPSSASMQGVGARVHHCQAC